MNSSLQHDKRFGHLFEHNSMFRELNQEHIKLKKEVDKLDRAFYLGTEMDIRRQELKKRKLDVKDKLEAMLASSDR